LVAFDAISQALQWQDMIVSEKGKAICKNGWQHGKIRPMWVFFRVFYFIYRRKGLWQKETFQLKCI